jgi:flagellar basal-body rod modification protein FlgD
VTTNSTGGVGSTTTSTSALPDRMQELGGEAFMTLLITQLQHQDPTNPMEDAEFIAQLATFSQLEKQTSMAESLKKIETILTELGPVTETESPSETNGGAA